MFFTEGGDEYLSLQLTVLQVVIKARCAGYPEKMGQLTGPVMKGLLWSKHGHQSDFDLVWW